MKIIKALGLKLLKPRRGINWQQSELLSQSGQVLILGLSMMMILVVVLLSLFNYGRLLNAKAKQTHTVDAAAYSGALIQARALNMQAYLNLAQVGHQIAMAHLVTLGSWAKFSATENRQYLRANPPSYLIGMMFGVAHQNAYAASRRASSIMSIAERHNELEQRYARHDEIVNDVLLEVAYAIREQQQKTRNAAIQEVIVANYPQHEVLAASDVTLSTAKDFKNHLQWTLLEDDFEDFTTIYKPTGNYRSLISSVAGVYKFLDPRQELTRNSWPVSHRCPHLRHELRRQGSTILNQEGNWQSIDTQSFHALRSNKWIGCYYREYPMGWGWVSGRFNAIPEGMEYSEDPPDNFANQDFWRWVKSATQWDLLGGLQNPLANSRAIMQRVQWGGGGLVPYIDINEEGWDSLTFELLLSGPEVGGHVMTVSARAESFFERYKARVDGKHEKANLWHPYWLARLISIDESSTSASVGGGSSALSYFRE
ncbi:MAG: Tad domain-containing protein [Alcaligenaceae bacterium]|nr:Tad domain-containing protein [Alcaligenaceae bacterium]